MGGKVRSALAADKARGMATMLPPHPSRAERLHFVLFNSEFHCVAAYRLGQYGKELRATRPVLAVAILLVHRVVNRFVTHLDHADIAPGAVIGPGFLVMHRHGILLGPVIIGKNCVVHQNVTIGQRVAGGEQGLPRIGNNVWIGPGAVVTGAISIGDGVSISAGAILSKDVPDRCLVAGNPARVIAKDYDNSQILGIHEA